MTRAVLVVLVAVAVLFASAALLADAKKLKRKSNVNAAKMNEKAEKKVVVVPASAGKPAWKAYTAAERAALSPVRQRMVAILDEFGESCVAQPKPSKATSVLASWSGKGPATSCGFVAGEFLRKLFPAAWKRSSKKIVHWKLNKLPAREQLLYRAMRRLFSGGTVNGPAAGRALGCLVETKNKQTFPRAGDVFYLRDKKYQNAAYATGKRGPFADENVAHVGTAYRAPFASLGAGDEGNWWQTVDGGQGSRANQCTHKMLKVQRFKASKDASGAEQPYMCMAGPAGVPGDSSACRVVHGWLDLDCVARAVDEYMHDADAGAAGAGKKPSKHKVAKAAKKAAAKAAAKKERYYF